MASPLSVSELDPLSPKASVASNVGTSSPKIPKSKPQYNTQKKGSYPSTGKYFTSNQKGGLNTTLWFGIAIVVIVAVTIAIIVGIIAHYGKELRRCRHELEKHKRESTHAQQLLENRLQQLDNQNFDFPPEQPMENMEEGPWVTEGTDPMGSRTKRDGAMMGDVIMDRELRNRQRLSSGGPLMFQPRV
jgi:hypothetical protein